jgi:hypothetical protein
VTANPGDRDWTRQRTEVETPGGERIAVGAVANADDAVQGIR